MIVSLMLGANKQLTLIDKQTLLLALKHLVLIFSLLSPVGEAHSLPLLV